MMMAVLSNHRHQVRVLCCFFVFSFTRSFVPGRVDNLSLQKPADWNGSLESPHQNKLSRTATNLNYCYFSPTGYSVGRTAVKPFQGHVTGPFKVGHLRLGLEGGVSSSSTWSTTQHQQQTGYIEHDGGGDNDAPTRR